ncbi:MAG TPA: hypothetical protein VFI24_20525 [Pyrinomonadaceae bacterium]|nr:hypothetical protein [Pyrinomonadaceae bacterium]
MNNNHTQFREMAGRLAHLFDTEEGERILRLITQLSASPDEAVSLTNELKKPSTTAGKLSVGIWEAKDEPAGRSFVRVDGEPWHLWANVQKIPPKGPRRRVVLVGESAAKGYLYHPRFTVAQVLQQMMNAACGPAQIEVVDLARVNILHDQLQELITQSVHLEPDALIVFAGNNWSPLSYAPEGQLLEIASAFRATGSWSGVKESCESFLIAHTRKTLDLLEEIARERGIPVVFVIPEFNLVDWITDCDCPPLLSSEQTEAWLRARDEAEQLLKGDAWEKAEGPGNLLTQLDQGTTPVGFNVLAEVSRKRGDHQAARRFLELARDAVISWPGRQTPRCYSVIQQTIRAEAPARGIHVVDLPREFTKHLDGEVADLRLFLDYCHLTLEGIRVAMALTAEALLPLLKYPVKSCKELAQLEIKVGANVSAGAHFLAAVYNGNWGQRMDVIRHHIRKALEFDRSIAEIMRLFLDFHIKRVPASLCRSFEQLWESPHVPAIIVLYNDQGGNFLNSNLVNVMADELEEIGIPIRSDMERLIIQEHGVEKRPVNLVDTIYSISSYSRFLVDRRPEFYKATTRTTTFPLVCDKPEPLHFSVTMKVLHGSAQQTISLRLNGNVVAEIAATDHWATTTCSAPAELVHAGVNQVEIEWPMPVWSAEKQRERVADSLESGELVEITPMFGLIHSFRVSTERSASPHKSKEFEREFIDTQLLTEKSRAVTVGEV